MTRATGHALIAASCCALAQVDESAQWYIGQAMREARRCVALIASGKAKEGVRLEEALILALAPCSSSSSAAYQAFLHAGMTGRDAARHAREFANEAARNIKLSVDLCMRPQFIGKATVQDCLDDETRRR